MDTLLSLCFAVSSFSVSKIFNKAGLEELMQLELRLKSKAMMKACMFTFQICKGWKVDTRTQLNFLQALRNEILIFKKCSLDEGAVSALFVLVNRIILTFIICLCTGC